MALMNYRSKCLFSVFLLFFIFSSLKGQNRNGSIIKIGINPVRYSVAFHFEVEKYFKRRPFLTHGPGLDLMVFGYSREIIYKYNFAVYPFYGWANKGPFNWLYIGSGPIFYHNFTAPSPNHGAETYSYGPGISVFAGIQYVYKDRFTFGADITPGYFMNLKKDSMENHGYFIWTWGLKFGFMIN
jgi:hypothetical protein